MQQRLPSMRGEPRDHGFALTEMLVAVVIIGILAGVSIPLYLNYRKSAENKSAESDVRAAITSAERYYTENGNVYPATVSGVKSTNLSFPAVGGVAQTVTVSKGNTVNFLNNGTTYVICGQNDSGLVIFVFNSATAQPVGKSTQATLATCTANGN